MEHASSAQLPSKTLALLKRHNLLLPLIKAEVIERAVKSVKIETEESEKLLTIYRENKRLTNNESLADHLTQRGLAKQDLQWQLELPVRKRKYAIEHFQHKAKARFLERKNQLDRVIYSLLRINNPFIAKELFLRIIGGEASFADLAATYSQGSERNTKGIVGPAPLTQAHPVLAEKLRTSKPGEVMEPFQVGEWWLIAKLESYQPARFDQDVEIQMSLELFKEWMEEESTRRIRHLIPEEGLSLSE